MNANMPACQSSSSHPTESNQLNSTCDQTKPKPNPKLNRLSEFLRGAGLKTALVSAPHRAVSVLVHSEEAAVVEGRDDVWLMLGVHPQQVGRSVCGGGGGGGKWRAIRCPFLSPGVVCLP